MNQSHLPPKVVDGGQREKGTGKERERQVVSLTVDRKRPKGNLSALHRNGQWTEAQIVV